MFLQAVQVSEVPGAVQCASHWPAEPALAEGGQRAGVCPHHPDQCRVEGAVASVGSWYLGAHSFPLVGSAPLHSEAHGSPTDNFFLINNDDDDDDNVQFHLVHMQSWINKPHPNMIIQ